MSEPLPSRIPCSCGYVDYDFCPLHGTAMREIAAAMNRGGFAEAERVAATFKKREDE